MRAGLELGEEEVWGSRQGKGGREKIEQCDRFEVLLWKFKCTHEYARMSMHV